MLRNYGAELAASLRLNRVIITPSGQKWELQQVLKHISVGKVFPPNAGSMNIFSEKRADRTVARLW